MTGNHPLQVKNRQRELWLYDGHNCYFFPQNWCDEIVDENEPELELYGYCPTHTMNNSPVDTLWIPCKDLESMTEVWESDAKKLHPRLIFFLDQINKTGNFPSHEEQLAFNG